MIEIKNKKDCCGCWACENICPKSCISMVEDNEGFRYPHVDDDNCIDCHLCEKVCPIINSKPQEEFLQKGFLLQYKDEEILLDSTSGGAYTALAKLVLSQQGVVFGVAFNENNEAQHICVENEEELWKFRNSKYVQSLIGHTYNYAKSFLNEGRLVLFSGTPCQIEGLLSFLRREYNNLITVDVVCRAVPSPKVLRKYLEYRAKDYGYSLTNIKFRDKKFYGYKYSNMSFVSNKNVYHEGIDTDPWLRSFFSGINVRPSCFSCRFKKRYRLSDFTIWDCFNVGRFDKIMDNDKGVTRVLVHSEKAKNMINDLERYAYIKEFSPDILTDGVVQLVESASENSKREAFFLDIDKLSPSNCFKKYFPVTLRTLLEKEMRILMFKIGFYKQFRVFVKNFIHEVKR